MPIIPPIVHASDRSGSGPEPPPQRRELGVQDVEHHPRLNHHFLGPDVDDPAEMPAEVEDQPRPQRLPRHARPRPSRVNRQTVLDGIAHREHDVVLGPGTITPSGSIS